MRHLPKLSLGLLVLSLLAMPVAAKAEPFTLPELGYSYKALQPAIDAKTMETHHSKHHKAYIDNLNKEVANTAALQGKSLEEIMGRVSSYSAAVRNNAGGHWNHTFFWEIMAPKGQTGDISEALSVAITEQYGSLDAMKEEFVKAGSSRFGSGWVWLIVKKDKTLEIVSTPNQDNPLMNDAPVKGTPVLGNDVWEHAYYLNYQNRRGDYLNTWWDVVNWGKVSALYEQAVQ